MTSRVRSKNKEKKANRKDSVKKKRDQTEKKNGTKKQKTASVYLQVQATPLTTAPQ